MVAGTRQSSARRVNMEHDEATDKRNLSLEDKVRICRCVPRYGPTACAVYLKEVRQYHNDDPLLASSRRFTLEQRGFTVDVTFSYKTVHSCVRKLYTSSA